MEQHNQILKTLDYIPADIVCAQDYERLAPNFIPADRFAYISGGSGQDITLANNLSAFSQWNLSPRVFTELGLCNTKISVAGQTFKHPILLAPVAYQNLVHPHGEIATAMAAESTDSCMIASTLSSFTLEDIAKRAGQERWFQLYFQPTIEETTALLDRAVEAGYKAIVITVDASVQAPSLRAVRAGFSLPKQTIAANLQHQTSPQDDSGNSETSRVFQAYKQNSITTEKLKWLVDYSPLPVLVKGVLNSEDASTVKDLGAAGLVVSNHGGRTVDGITSSLSMLPGIRKTVGEHYPVLFDGGIRSGQDIFKAMALGADAVLIGRLQVYALSVAGALGVAHLIKLLREELELCMAVTGRANAVDICHNDLFQSLTR